VPGTDHYTIVLAARFTEEVTAFLEG